MSGLMQSATSFPAFLAQAAMQGGAAPLLKLPTHWPSLHDAIDWTARMPTELTTILVIAGVVYLLWGFYLSKGLIVLNAAAAGGLLGAIVGQKAGAVLPCAIFGAFVAGTLTLTMLKWAVAFMGGLYGAVVGACLWRAFDLDPRFLWSGAGMGLISGGLLCFILFKGCVMMFTSLQGAAMLAAGLLSLICKYNGSTPRLAESLQLRPMLTPMVLFIATVLGMLYQQKSLKPKPPAGPPVKK